MSQNKQTTSRNRSLQILLVPWQLCNHRGKEKLPNVIQSVVITKTQISNSEKLHHSEILESSPDLTWDSDALLIELAPILWLDTVWTSDINSFLTDK